MIEIKSNQILLVVFIHMYSIIFLYNTERYSNTVNTITKMDFASKIHFYNVFILIFGVQNSLP